MLSIIKSRIVKIAKNKPSYIFIFLATVAVVFVFYTSGFRQNVENYFYDLRTQWMPDLEKIDGTVVIISDEKTPEALKTKSYGDILVGITGALAQTQAKTIGILIFPEFFKLNSDQSYLFDKIITYDDRFLIGTLGYNYSTPSVLNLPQEYKGILDRVSGVESFKKSGRSVLRNYPATSFRGLSQKYSFPVQVALKARNSYVDPEKYFRLKPIAPDKFTTLRAEDIILNRGKFEATLAGKIIIYADVRLPTVEVPTSPRVWLKTPLLKKGFGTHIVYTTAAVVQNFVTKSYLKTPNVMFNVAQILFMAAILFYLWRLPSAAASSGSLLLIFVMFWLHTIFYRYLNFDLPLADCFLFYLIIVILCLLKRLEIELKLRTHEEVDLIAKEDSWALQARFFEQFSSLCLSKTEEILATCQNNLQGPQAYLQRFSQSCEEFRYYLQDMKNAHSLESVLNSQRKNTKFDLGPWLQKIIQRFETKLTEKNMQIIIANDVKSLVDSAPQILDVVLFNLISNAVSYAPDGSKIFVSVAFYKYIFKPSILEIKIRDQGPGIAREFHEKIFEKFYRIKNEEIYRVRGSGMGLYLARYFTRQLGGELTLKSKLQEGAEFCIRI